MAAHAARSDRRRRAAWRPVAAATVGGAVLVTTGFGVWATLNATASATAENVSSGTLKLAVAATGATAGFTSAISNLAPGDIVNRYVDVTNNGTLDAQALTMTIASSSSTGTSLLTDGTTSKALRIAVNSCAAGWNTSTGACTSGTATQVLAPTAVGSLSSAATLISGAMTSGSVQHLQVVTQLPDQTETTVNGALPTGTIQGQSATLTYTFGETQRTATTTNS